MLADDVTFEGPVAKASGVAESVAGLVEGAGRGAAGRRWGCADLVGGPGRPTVAWLRVDGERITAIRTVFDARETGGR